MEGTRFDTLAKELAEGRTRRSVLRGLIGGGAALLATRAGTSLAAPKEKVTICHWAEDLGYYEEISVSPNAVAAHTAHQHGMDKIDPDFSDIATCGDCNTVCNPVDACTPARCDNGTCNAISGCGSVDSCTPAACLSDATCKAVSSCAAVDPCTPGRCDGGICNAVSDCDDVDPCTPASGVSRRSLVKWLAGVVGGASVVAVHDTDVLAAELGEPCNETDLICTTGLDCGILGTCCIVTGDTCSTGTQCCSQACPSGECCEGLGATCSEGDCCGSLLCEGGSCCVPEGNSCGSDLDCCGDVLCNDSICGDATTCVATGDTCLTGAECCSQACLSGECCEGLGSICPEGDCCGSLQCEGGSCCAPEGNSCPATSTCCGNLVCASGTCVDCLESDVTGPACAAGPGVETPVCCKESAIYNPNTCQCRVLCETGVSCLSDANCDGDEYCDSGCCTPCRPDGEGIYCATEQACCSLNCDMNNCGCRSIQTDCTSDEQCCSGICSDEEPRVCLPPELCSLFGDPCETTQDCCDDDPRYEVHCEYDVCTACNVTGAIPGRCVAGTDSELECCDPEAIWNSYTCMCEIACKHKDDKCHDDEECCDDLQCIHDVCGKHQVCAGEKVACDDKHPCCKGYICVDGHCKAKKRPDPPSKPEESPADESGGTDSVDTLPSTGAGPGQGNEALGLLLAGGAAAAAAAWLVKDKSKSTTS